MEKACFGCGHLLGKKDKVCRLCGTKVGTNKPVQPASSIPIQPTSNTQPPMETDVRDIKVFSMGKIMKRIFQLLIVVFLIDLAI